MEVMNVSYRIVVEPQELEQYAAVIDRRKILALPFSNLGQGSIPARNWVWEHSIKEATVRPMLIGQAPSGSGAGAPLAGGSSGRRLARLLGTDLRDLPRLFRLRNLLGEYPGPGGGKGDAFPAVKAREAARGRASEATRPRRGFGVTAAFGEGGGLSWSGSTSGRCGQSYSLTRRGFALVERRGERHAGTGVPQEVGGTGVECVGCRIPRRSSSAIPSRSTA